ncbi:MAG: hypothetical protein FWB85_02605 [Chitinispirillia bacterium]|nr:hypothetical protein [Chitinispirillia bacterium]MCL2241315.1 hypothetical protein [Chitinispirillia bacterium]
MITKSRIKEELELLPEVEYPAEVVERWYKEGEIALQQLATVELVPQTIEELVAELGIKRRPILSIVT